MSEKLQHTSATPPIDEEVEAQQRAGARRTALLLVLLMLVIAGAAFYYLWNMRAAQVSSDETINVLLLGVADHKLNDNVEALVLTSFNPKSKAVEAVALPVNTVVPSAIPASAAIGTGATGAGAIAADNLRDVYADGDRTALTQAIEQMIGAPVHHTVRVDFSGFVELVDLLGGVPVEVQVDVLYKDADGETVFHLAPGLQRLSGEEALLYVRYKGDHLDDESRRVERQWQLIQAVMAEARTKLGWKQAQQLIGIAFNHVATDLDLAGLTRLLQTVFDSERDIHALHMLPGQAVDGHWLVDPERVASLSGQMFHNPSWQTKTQ